MTPTAASSHREGGSARSDDPGRWLHQTRMTDPGPEASMLDGLPSALNAVCRIVQGVLIHLEWVGAYGLSERDFARASRDTLSLSDRLRRLADADPRPLAIPRMATARSPGTCRDYALMLCGLLRHHGIPARVRCGFAAYFREGHWEDHWICEAWAGAERRWRRIDAQLDDVLGERLGITFDPTDLPSNVFMSAGDAWRRCRSGGEDPEMFGHGPTCGMWFMRVNVMRDHLVLNGAEVSAWDTWRNATAAHHVLLNDDVSVADDIVTNPAQAMRMMAPPWGA